ncbi:NAD-dependent epimerase/dehydratase family protein [Porticoccaceae bacterium]|nr:NAD-dependent epimerase/dehydratase family protein [Porticoccaceae bacterium]
MSDSVKKKVLVTGSSGFIGSHVVSEFINLGYEVVGVSRSEQASSHVIRDISGDTDWSDVLEDIDIIIHCAAAVHQIELSENVLNSYRQLNVDGTLNLAEQAKATVKRFIFLSTVKVNGEETFSSNFFTDDRPNPLDPYGISKERAEAGLREIAKSSKMEIVIIRPPLVYGPNPKGNLEKLAKYLDSKMPLPFGLVTSNSRSLLYIGNLVDFIYICAVHKAAVNETFLISDDSDLATASIISLIGKALDVRPILLPVPVFVLKILFKALGKKEYGSRLLGNLCVDVTKNKQLLDWKPKYSVEEGFHRSFKK